MAIISGTIKSSKSNICLNKVKCKFKYDDFGGIRKGVFPNLLILNPNQEQGIIGNSFLFKSKYVSMYIYIHKIRGKNVFFQTRRIRRIVNRKYSKDKFTFFTTETEIIHYMKLNFANEELILTNCSNCNIIEIDNSTNIDKIRLNNCKDIVEDILFYIQLTQLAYCKTFGYAFKNIIFIDYSNIKLKPYIYRKTNRINNKDVELFLEKFNKSKYKDYISKIIYRLVCANKTTRVEQQYIWLIFAMEAIESLFQKKYKDDNLLINIIVEKFIPTELKESLVKIHYKKQKYWRLLIWIYRDRLAHFIENINELKRKPDPGQDKILEYIFTDKHKILIEEFKKCLPVSQRLICQLIDFDYDNKFLKLYESINKNN